MSPRSTGTSGNRDDGAARTRRLIVSFHDLHPGSRGAAAEFLALLAATGIRQSVLLVVPRWHGGPACTADGDFIAWLGELAATGHELCLHGCTHRAERVTGSPVSRLIGTRYTQGEGEFFQLSREAAARRVRDGLAVLAGEAGLPIYGFTPPAWLLSADGRDALRAAGLHYTTSWSGVELLQQPRNVAAPTLVYSCRNRWRRTVSCSWVRLWHAWNRRVPLLRIAVHPGDFSDPRLVASLRRHLARAAATRVATTYRGLLPADAAPVGPPVGVRA